MPRFLSPHRSGAHRLAALALYRALLTQCRALPLPSASRDELQNIVRHRFKHTRSANGAVPLRISFEAGYEAVAHMDASVAGDASSTDYLTSLLQRAPQRLKVPPVVKQAPASKEESPVGAGAGEKRPSIFDRPLPLAQLSGPRHVPVLFNANRLPVLRIKKPQPESLSRMIRQRLEQRQHWQDRRARLVEDRKIATLEDEWDVLALATDGKREPSWTKAINDAIVQVGRSLEEEKEKNRKMAERMQAIVDAERALFEEEKAGPGVR